MRSAAFATLLLAVLGAAWAAGAAVRLPPPGSSPAAPAPADYAFLPRTTTLDAGRPGEYVFTITGPGPLTAPPRLSVVRRDVTGLQHPTPVADPDGTWRAPLTPPAAGGYRVLAEITPPDGPQRTLAADLVVPGEEVAVPFTVSRVVEVDGYQVRLDGDLGPPGAQVFATVSRDGVPVSDLEPVDGAFGRLEALRADDLAPARIHPDAAPPAPTDRAGPGLAFTAEVPGAGTYRLFLDFRHGGALHTAVFTLVSG